MSASRPPRLFALVSLLALLCLSVLSACGSADDQASDSDSTSATTSSSAPSPDPTSDSASGSSGAAGSAGGACDYTADSSGTTARKVDLPPTTPDVSGTVTATLDTSIGTLTFNLDADSAPCTVNSFVSLAKQGYFDKTTCHRLTEATSGIAVLQCGDPTATGTGGPGYTIPDELTGNTGDYPTGTLAMANTGREHSGGSQFFIVYGESTLGPLYSIFGTVDQAGIEAIQKVADAGTDDSNGPGDGTPTTPVDITSATIGS